MFKSEEKKRINKCSSEYFMTTYGQYASYMKRTYQVFDYLDQKHQVGQLSYEDQPLLEAATDLYYYIKAKRSNRLPTKGENRKNHTTTLYLAYSQ